MTARLIANLESHGPLGSEDRAAVAALVGAVRAVPAETEMVVDGQTALECQVLLEGQAFRHKTTADGRRQIIAFLAPGDILDLQRVLMGVDFGVTALTACHTAPIYSVRLEALMQARPAIGRAIWRTSFVEASIQREWMIGMGRRTAHARVAHLLCEVFLRLSRLGLTQGERCRFPWTQSHIADAAGLSGVHTNRVLQALRRRGLIVLRNRELRICDWAALAAIAEFDPAYLHLSRIPRAPAVGG